MVGIEWCCESDGVDLRSAVRQGASDTVHGVHDAPFVVHDDRVRRVRLPEELAVLDDLADGGHLSAPVEPVRRIDLADRGDGEPLDGQVPAQGDETIDVPRVEAPIRRQEVVLLPHRRSSLVLRTVRDLRRVQQPPERARVGGTL